MTSLRPYVLVVSTPETRARGNDWDSLAYADGFDRDDAARRYLESLFDPAGVVVKSSELNDVAPAERWKLSEPPSAGMLTSELKVGLQRVEVLRQDGEAAVRALLEAGAGRVNVVTWVHSWNLPGALPAVRANCSSMTNYSLNAAGELVAQGVDIFERSY